MSRIFYIRNKDFRKNWMAISTTLVLLFGVVLACSKKREPKFTETPDSRVLPLSELGAFKLDSSNSVSKIVTAAHIRISGKTIENCPLPSLLALCEKPSYTLSSSSDFKGPEGIRYMFDNLLVSGNLNESLGVVFRVDEQNLEAFKIVGENEFNLSHLERDTALRVTTSLNAKLAASNGGSNAASNAPSDSSSNKEKEVLLVPLFKYKIKAKGILERKKNANGEETSEIVLSPRDLKDATHIQVDTGTESRTAAPYLAPGSDNELYSYFVADTVHNRNFTLSELETLIGAEQLRALSSALSHPLSEFQVQINPTIPTNPTAVKTDTADKTAKPKGPSLNIIDPNQKNLLLSLEISFVRAELTQQRTTGKRAETITFKILPVEALPNTMTSGEEPGPKGLFKLKTNEN